MGKIKQLISWVNSGLNFDDDKRLFAPGDSDSRMNVTTSELGREFVISNMKGTIKKSHTFTHAAAYLASVYTVVGSYYEDNRDAVYIFLYGSAGNDSIIRYLFSDDSFEKIAWDQTNLGLDPAFPLTDLFIIEDWLHFNPRSTSPRVINVQWAYYDWVAWEYDNVNTRPMLVGEFYKEANKVYEIVATGFSTDDDIADFEDKMTFTSWTYHDIIRKFNHASLDTYRRNRTFNNTTRSLPNRPYIAAGTDTGTFANYIRGNIFQFAIRIYIPDQGYSIASTFSDVVMNANDEAVNGELVGDVTTNNYIRIGWNLGDDTGSDTELRNDQDNLFETIEFLFRKNGEADWFVAGTLEHDEAIYNTANNPTVDDSEIYSIDFYNDLTYVPADSATIEKQYNALPLTSKAQWSLDGERSAYGGIEEGFFANTGAVDITLGNPGSGPEYVRAVFPDLQTSGAINGTMTSFGFTIVHSQHGEDVIQFTHTSGNVDSTGGGASNFISITMDDQTWDVTVDASTDLDLATGIATAIDVSGVTAYVETVAGPNYRIIVISDGPHNILITVFTTSAGALTMRKVPSFKTNASHSFCQYYYDEVLRRSEPIVSPDMTHFVPAIPDIPSGPSEGTNWQAYITWTVRHKAPSWAKYWRWGYAGNNSIEKFWQYNIEGVIDPPADADFADYIAIDISGLQELGIEGTGHENLFTDTNIDPYTFAVGDRVKFITKYNAADSDYTDVDIADGQEDFEIKAFDDINHILYIDDASVTAADYGAGVAANAQQVLIEIYRPRKSTDNMIYYEIGPLLNVVESGDHFIHQGESQDQNTGATPAQGQFNIGDVYLITRNFAEGPFGAAADILFVESYDWSDFYESDMWGRGKSGFISSIGRKYLNNVRYGNKFSPNTRSSGLSTFDFLDYKTLSIDHGNIIAMRQVGHSLKVYFERNSASITINKTQFYDADGTSQVVKSDDILGTADYSNYNFGTIFPESVLLIDRTIYFYDIYRKSYCRDSANGVFPISTYKANKYFIDKSDALLASGVANVKVWSAYDPERKFVYVMFSDSTGTTNDDVIVYNERRDRWETQVKMKESIQVGAMVRNEELDYRLTSTSETAIEMLTITAGTNRITFRGLPEAFEAVLQDPTSGEEWLCINLDTYAGGGSFDRAGDYVDSLLITGYDSDDEEYTYTEANGAEGNWTGTPEVVFINPFRFFDFHNSNNFMIEKDDITIGGETISAVTSGPMFVHSDGTFVNIVVAQGVSRKRIVPVEATDPTGAWTSTDAEIFTPTDFNGSAVDAWPEGNALYLEDEALWLVACSVEVAASVTSIGLYKFDEDFGGEVFYHSVVIGSLSLGAFHPSIVLHDGTYYIFFVDHEGASPDTSEWSLKVVSSIDYTDFSGSTPVTILTNTQTSDGADGLNQNKWYNATIYGSTAFTYQGRLYLMVNGDSRYEVSGNRGNSITGLFEYNASTGSADVVRTGVVFPGMLDAPWSNTAWGANFVQTPMNWVRDVANERYIAGITQSPGSTGYAIGFATFALDTLFDEDDEVSTALPDAVRTTAGALISFIDEDMYVHNSNSSRGYFYNTLKKMVFNVIINEQPMITKVLDSITLNTNNGEWSITDIVIPPTANYPRGMYSKIPNAIFTKREDGIHAEFLRNMKTSSSTALLIEIRTGSELRGQTATLTFENSESSEVVLLDVLVNMSNSPI